MAAFLRAALGPGVDDERVDAYCEGSPDHFDWLVSVGVPFRAAFCDEPNRESADDAGLLFSGGEDTYPFDEIAVPVPRGHKPQYIDSAGGFLMERLGAAVPTSGARVVADARAEALVVDGGDVVGVHVRTDEGARAIAGPGRGRSWRPADSSTTRRWWPSTARWPTSPTSVWRIGTPNDDGRGIRMGVGVGAATTRLDAFECALPLGPPHRLARGILVNRHGERFINEDTYTGRIGLHALRDQDGFVYMITDDVIHEPNLLGLRVAFAAATPEELAVDLGVSARRARSHSARVQRGGGQRRGPGIPQARAVPAAHRRAAGERHRRHRPAGRPRRHLRHVHARRSRHRSRRRRARRRRSTRSPVSTPPGRTAASLAATTTPAASASATARSSAAAPGAMRPLEPPRSFPRGRSGASPGTVPARSVSGRTGDRVRPPIAVTPCTSAADLPER